MAMIRKNEIKNILRALVIADTAPQINIPETLRMESIDVFISLGDLLPVDFKGLDTVNNVPKIGVRGNHDSIDYMPMFGIKNLHLKSYTLRGVSFAGFEGCVKYKNTAVEPLYTQEEAYELIKLLPKADVIITHCPPRGVNDHKGPHQGWDALRKYVVENKPKLLMHGHTYPNENCLITKYCCTEIEYVRGYKIIDIAVSV